MCSYGSIAQVHKSRALALLYVVICFYSKTICILSLICFPLASLVDIYCTSVVAKPVYASRCLYIVQCIILYNTHIYKLMYLINSILLHRVSEVLYEFS